jgi:hypothetical protein
MEATCFSKMSVNFQQATHYHTPEDRTLHNHEYKTSNPTVFLFLLSPHIVVVHKNKITFAEIIYSSDARKKDSLTSYTLRNSGIYINETPNIQTLNHKN